MIGLLRKCTHVCDAHIEQMPGVVCAVGEAATDFFRKLNHSDFGSTRRQRASQVHRSEGAAGTTPDDGNTHDVAPVRHASHSRCISLSILSTTKKYLCTRITFALQLAVIWIKIINRRSILFTPCATIIAYMTK